MQALNNKETSMAEKVKVVSIVVVFPGGERREMTIDEAKALHLQLAELFGAKPLVVEVPTYVYRDRWPRIIEAGPQPVWYETPLTLAPPPSSLPTVWCKTDSTQAIA